MTSINTLDEQIPLSMHGPLDEDPQWPAQLNIDYDADSSCDPSHWVHFIFTTEDYDAERIQLTLEEAERAMARLARVLGAGYVRDGVRHMEVPA